MPDPVLVKQVPPAVQAHPSLWGNRRFLLLLSSYSISLFGNTFHSIALSLWVLQTTGSAKMIAIITIINLVLSSLLGSIGGTFADRVNRRTLMLITDLISCGLVVTLALAISLPSTSFIIVAILTGLTTVSALFQSPAYQASITTVVGKEHLQKAVGLLNLSENICRTIGYSAGGIFVASFGAADAILFDGATFFLSFLLVLAVRSLPLPTQLNNAPKKERKFTQDLVDGIRYIWRYPFARAVMIMLPTLTLFFVPSLMLTQVMAVKVWDSTPFQFGLIEACIPLGYMIGSGLILLLGSKLKNRGFLIMTGLLCLGPLYLLLSFVTSAAIAIPIILVIGFMFSFSTLLINTILRLEVSEDIQGRVFGVLGSIMSVAPSIGLTAVSFLSDLFSPGPVMGSIGVLLLLFALSTITKLKVIRNYK
ncbi:MFS transporter [Paenibacillus odorifer]|uniref:MFS transporter n=1 Tax=Paenibacillus odorifer TaxID=189426 RepID=A0A1R0XA82_9BACL|nr:MULTISPECIES: MFS transporter [Paenibacillus]ETT46162.1 major facilitator superfamily protein [Paenibacillus sp. FSL H8-237]OMD31712.1 MFS transporter [Paenibacillus odorifer]OME23281.1 MFS transporter [Paenibacillus odorifer]OME34219.1 MFS transporter [Paenibacillus odorifer]OME37326.1 MFS transporter [Paenibacillus odorifer]